MNRDILSKIEQEQMISREELEELLTTTDQELYIISCWNWCMCCKYCF